MRVYILRGVSGAGKSHMALRRCEMAASKACTIISADTYMVDEEGVYLFSAAKLQECHRRCLAHFIELLQRKEHDVIYVDNTNTRLVEVAPYYRVAEALQAEVRVITVLCDPVTAWERSEHVTELALIIDQHNRLMSEPTFPFWKRETIAVGRGD